MRNIPMDLLRTLATVADGGSVTRAAASLGRSQPAISLQLKRLEGIVGATLFRWDGRRLGLTDSGETLLGYARRILRLNDEAIGGFVHPPLEGHVRVGTPNDFAITFLPRILGKFAERHPGVTLEVTCDLSVNLLREFAADESRFDLVLAMQAERSAGRPACEWPETLTWVVSSAHEAWARRPVPLVAYPEGCVYRHRMTQALDRAGIPWRIVFCSPSLAGLQAAIVSGLGVTVLATSTVPDGLQVADPVAALPAMAPAIVRLHQRRNRLEPAAAQLSEFLAESLSHQPRDGRTAQRSAAPGRPTALRRRPA